MSSTDTTTTATSSAFSEVETVLNWLANILPTALTDVSIFDPGLAAAIGPFVPLFQAAVQGVDAIGADVQEGGKTLEQVVADTITAMSSVFNPPAASS